MFKALAAGLKFLPSAIEAGKGIINLFKGDKDQNKKNKKIIDDALEYQINELKNQKSRIEEINKRDEERIRK